MSTADASPALDRLLESVARRLPHDALEDLAALRPPFDLTGGDVLAVEVARLLQAKAKEALEDEKAGPLPDDFQFNEETWEARRELESGGGIRYTSLEDFLKAHDI
jgi:hypothetical protein